MNPLNPYTPAGAVVQYLQSVFGGPFEDKETFPAVTVAPFVVVQRNPERTCLTIMNTSDADVWIATRQQLAVQRGVKLPAGSGFISMNAAEDATLPSLDWFGIGSVAGTIPMYVLEAIRIRAFDPSAS